MNKEFDITKEKFLSFKQYFLDEEDVELGKLYISIFDGWLSEEDYIAKVEKASKDEIIKINTARLNFFKQFIDDCVIYDAKLNKFLSFASHDSFINKCTDSLDDSEDFLIFDYKHNVVLNTSYDFTDICYFTEDSDLAFVRSIASKSGLFSFLSE